MSSDLEYLRATTFNQYGDPLEKYRQMETNAMAGMAANTAAEMQEEEQYRQQQTAQVQQTQAEQADTTALFSTMGLLIDDLDTQAQFNAAVADTKKKAQYGDPYSKGVPRSIIAADNYYRDTLHMVDVAEGYDDYFDEEKRAVINAKAAAARERLVKTHMDNSGATQEEAEARVFERYKNFEVPSLFEKLDQYGLNVRRDPADIGLARNPKMKTPAGEKVTSSLIGERLGGAEGPEITPTEPVSKPFKEIWKDTRQALKEQAALSDQAGKNLFKLMREELDTQIQGAGKKAGEQTETFIGNRVADLKTGASMTVGFAAHNLMKTLELMSIIDAPLTEGGMQITNVLSMSDEEFLKHYPEDAARVSRLAHLEGMSLRTPEEDKEAAALRKDLTTVNWAERLGVSLREGAKAWGRDVVRIATGQQYDPAVLNEFASNVTDDPRMQSLVKMVMPFVSIVPILGAEMSAVRMANKAPHLFHNFTALGRFMDYVVPGRPSAWIGTSEMLGRATVQSVESASRTQVAADREAARRVWERQHVEGKPPAYGPAEAVSVDYMQKLSIGDFSTPEMRDLGRDIVRRVNAADGASEADRAAAARLMVHIEEAEAFSLTGAGVGVAPPIVRNFDERVQKVVDNLVVKHEAYPDPTLLIQHKAAGRVVGDLPKGTKTFMSYDPSITAENVVHSTYGEYMSQLLVDRGYSPNTMQRLITNDVEAKLFVLLHEEGHVTHGDPHLPVGNLQNSSYRQILASAETAADMYAFRRFGEITGKRLHELHRTNFTPASFADITMDGRVVYTEVPNPERMFRGDHPNENYRLMVEGGTEKNYMTGLKSIAAWVKNSGKGAQTEPYAHYTKWGVVNKTRIVEKDFAELGKLFDIYPREISNGVGMPAGTEGFEAFTKRVYQAFLWRFGATKAQQSAGTMRFPDANPVYSTGSSKQSGYLSEPQLAKMEEIINAYRGINGLVKEMMGTAQEEAALNMYLWFKSYIANGGSSWEAVVAHTRTLNRLAEAYPSQTRQTAGQLLNDYSGSSINAAEKAGNKGVTADEFAPIGAGSDTVLVWEAKNEFSTVGKEGKANQQHGGEGVEITTADATDAMANTTSLSDIVRRDKDGTPLMEELSITSILRERAALRAEQMQPVPMGAVDVVQPTIKGSPDDIIVMHWEDFSNTPARPGVVLDGKVNIFLAGAKELEGAASSIHNFYGNSDRFKEIYARLVSDQIGVMARSIAENGADSVADLVIFNRAMATAKAMSEIIANGEVTASTARWLDSYDFKSAARGLTHEERVVNGIGAAADDYGFMLTMQKNSQRAIDTHIAEIFDSLPENESIRSLFIDEYGKMMTGPEAVTKRGEYNKAKKRLIGIVGDACAKLRG